MLVLDEMAIHVPYMALKGVFFLHMVLCIWAQQSGWIPISYLFYNSFFLITILWSIHLRDSEEGPFMAVCINFLSIGLDIMTFVFYWPSSESWSAVSRFGAVCAISNLLLRPISVILLYRLFAERAGTYGNFVTPSGIESFFGGNRRSPYEDIDQTGSQPTNINGLENAPKELGSPDSLFSS